MELFEFCTVFSQILLETFEEETAGSIPKRQQRFTAAAKLFVWTDLDSEMSDGWMKKRVRKVALVV